MNLLTCGHNSTDTKDINNNKNTPGFTIHQHQHESTKVHAHKSYQKKALPSVKDLSRKKFLIKSYLTPVLKTIWNILINFFLNCIFQKCLGHGDKFSCQKKILQKSLTP